MFKKSYVFIWVFGIFLFGALSSCFSFEDFMSSYEPSSILSSELDEVVNTKVSADEEISDPFRQGAYRVIHGENGDKKVGGVIYNDNEIKGHGMAEDKTLAIVQRGVRYALSFVSFFALVYLLYNGVLMITAAGDETKYKKAWKSLKTVLIALLGLGLSWLIVSMIFWLIKIVTE